MESGQIGEARPLHFFVPSSPPTERCFSGISPQDVDVIVAVFEAEDLSVRHGRDQRSQLFDQFLSRVFAPLAPSPGGNVSTRGCPGLVG
jgi:hypothetical protein